MRKMIVESGFVERSTKGRLLARVLAEDLRWVRGQKLSPFIASVVTGEVERDWSAPKDDGAPVF